MTADDVNKFQALPEPVGFEYTDDDGVRRKVDEWEPSPMPTGWAPTVKDPTITVRRRRTRRVVDPLL